MAQQRTTGGTREFDVLLRLRLSDQLPGHDLAQLAENILEAVEKYAVSCVDGPAVGYTLTPTEIHLSFSTDADNRADVEGAIDRVREVIEGETDLKFTLTTNLTDAAVSA